MTLTVDPLPAFFPVGQYTPVWVTITGGSPVHSVVLDFIGDGQPASYFTAQDARDRIAYHIYGTRKGRFELTVHAVDMMGCEVSNGVRLFATIQ